MTAVSRPVVRTDSRGRLTLANHPSQEFALKVLPGGSILLSPCTVTVETEFEKWLRSAVPNIDHALHGDTSNYLDFDTIRRKEDN